MQIKNDIFKLVDDYIAFSAWEARHSESYQNGESYTVLALVVVIDIIFVFSFVFVPTLPRPFMQHDKCLRRAPQHGERDDGKVFWRAGTYFEHLAAQKVLLDGQQPVRKQMGYEKKNITKTFGVP